MKRAEVVVQWSETVNNQALVYTTVPDDLDVNDSEALWEHFNEMLEDDWFQLIEDKGLRICYPVCLNRQASVPEK